MTLGERIASFRNANNMSQGDLAERLNVSRQSVSKWETNSSIPELDKLIQLSDLFQISLDELVREEERIKETTEQEVEPPQIIIQKPMVPAHKIIGYILLGFGLLCCILGLFAGRLLFLIGIYSIVCSIICILIQKHAGLIIGWITMVLLFFLTPAFTGIRIFSVFHPGYYRNGLSAIPIATIAIWFFLILLIVFTVRACRKKKE